MRELVQEDEVFAILNGLGTPTHTAVLDYLNQNEVPDLFVASGSTSWNEPEKYPYTFGFNADYTVEGAALAQYALDEHPGKTVCLLGQDDDFGDELIEGAEIALGEDGLTHVERYSVSNQDVTAQIGAMKAAGCEINLLATINGFTALAIGTAAQLGWFPLWFSSSSGADYPTLVGYLGEDVGPKLLQGFTGTNYLPALGGDSDWVSLFRQINEEYNDGAPLTGNTIYGMSVAYLFAEALEAAGENPTRQSLIEAITSGDLVGQRHPAAVLRRGQPRRVPRRRHQRRRPGRAGLRRRDLRGRGRQRRRRWSPSRWRSRTRASRARSGARPGPPVRREPPSGHPAASIGGSSPGPGSASRRTRRGAGAAGEMFDPYDVSGRSPRMRTPRPAAVGTGLLRCGARTAAGRGARGAGRRRASAHGGRELLDERALEHLAAAAERQVRRRRARRAGTCRPRCGRS